MPRKNSAKPVHSWIHHRPVSLGAAAPVGGENLVAGSWPEPVHRQPGVEHEDRQHPPTTQDTTHGCGVPNSHTAGPKKRATV